MYTSIAKYLAMYGAEQIIPVEKLTGVLEVAEREIDTLTFNRITAIGYEALTQFQKDLVLRAVYMQANFRYEYGAVLDNPLSSYGINGVSMSFDSAKVKEISGVYTSPTIYALLRQTGLTYRGLC